MLVLINNISTARFIIIIITLVVVVVVVVAGIALFITEVFAGFSCPNPPDQAGGSDLRQ